MTRSAQGKEPRRARFALRKTLVRWGHERSQTSARIATSIAAIGLVSVVLGADTEPLAEPAPSPGAFAGLVAAFPVIAPWAQAVAPPTLDGSGPGVRYHISARPPERPFSAATPSGRGKVTSWILDRGLVADVDGAGTLWVEDASTAVRVAVRREGSAGATATLDGGAVAVREAWRGVDAFVFAKGRSVEDLVLARRPSAAIVYAFDLPAMWQLSAPPGAPGLVQILDGAGIARLRLRVGESWDALGRPVAAMPEIEGNRVRIRVGEAESWPVLIDPQFESTGTMASPRADHTSTRLPDGRVLLAGGRWVHPKYGCQSLGSLEIFDPVTVTFTMLDATMGPPRRWHTATLLRSGEVLLAGGTPTCDDPNTVVRPGTVGTVGTVEAVETVETFEPRNGELRRVGDMTIPRYRHTATLVGDDDVLFAGGKGDASHSLELFTSPVTAGSIDVTGADGSFRSATLLRDPGTERVLLLLSKGDGGDNGVPEAYYFDNDKKKVGIADDLKPSKKLPAGHTATRLPTGSTLFVEASGTTGGLDAVLLDAMGTLKVNTSDFPDVPESLLQDHTATLLPGGRVLFVGGMYLGSTAMYEPATKDKDASIRPSATSSVARNVPVATLLLDGSVLVTGGLLAGNEATATATAEVFQQSPDEGQFEAQDALMLNRRGHTATLLPAGDILFTGGTSGDGMIEAQSWVCSPSSLVPAGCLKGQDPKGNCRKLVKDIQTARVDHTATLLRDGRVLVAGGSDGNGAQDTIEIFDSSGECGQFGTPSKLGLVTARQLHTATLLPNGDVLFAGGVSCPDVDSKCRQAEVFSANHPEVDESVGVMGSDRFGHTATLLGDGRVLLAGGSETEAGPALNTAEVYDPVSMQFNGTKGPMRSARKGHSATLLANGRVLLAGGTEGDYAEIYDPATRTFAKVKVDEHPMASAPSRAVMLPSGKVLLSAVHEGAEENKNAVEVALYDPLTDRFSKLAAPKMMILAGHSETLLPDGRVLFSGYRASGPSTWTWRDVADDNGDKLNITEIGRHSSWRIHGKLAGFSEGSSGTTNASATNLPTAVWMRIPDGVPLAGGLSDLSFGAADKMQPDEADYQPPVTLLRGPGLLFIQAGASRSPGQFLTFDGKVNGGGCTQDAECESGACADGYCCDTRCDGECQSCGLENYHGICSSIDPDHDQDDASCKHGRCETNADCGTQEVCGPPDPSTHRRTCENPISPAEGCSLVISGSDVPSRRPLLLSIFLLSLVARRVRGRRGTVARARR